MFELDKATDLGCHYIKMLVQVVRFGHLLSIHPFAVLPTDEVQTTDGIWQAAAFVEPFKSRFVMLEAARRAPVARQPVYGRPVVRQPVYGRRYVRQPVIPQEPEASVQMYRKLPDGSEVGVRAKGAAPAILGALLVGVCLGVAIA